jgi:hypothetical protein
MEGIIAPSDTAGRLGVDPVRAVAVLPVAVPPAHLPADLT